MRRAFLIDLGMPIPAVRHPRNNPITPPANHTLRKFSGRLGACITKGVADELGSTCNNNRACLVEYRKQYPWASINLQANSHNNQSVKSPQPRIYLDRPYYSCADYSSRWNEWRGTSRSHSILRIYVAGTSDFNSCLSYREWRPALQSLRKVIRGREKLWHGYTSANTQTGNGQANPGASSRATATSERRCGMSVYMVSYVFRPKRDISDLIAELKRTAWAHFWDETWLIGTQEVSGDLYNRLLPYFNLRTDSLLIIDLNLTAENIGQIQGWMPRSFWNWLRITQGLAPLPDPPTLPPPATSLLPPPS